MRDRVTLDDLIGVAWFLALIAEIAVALTPPLLNVRMSLEYWGVFWGLLAIIGGIPIIRERLSRLRP
jgi:hypothetical protein